MLYSGKKTNEIRFPLGGIGSGSINLAGNASLVDWEIFNRANKNSLNGNSHFAIRAEYPNGETVVKILQGDQIQNLGGLFGATGTPMAAYPHFKKVKFDATFPIATITLEDDNFPAKVILKAFNPLIPLDAYNSSIPSAFFEIDVKSKVDGIKYLITLAVKNPFKCGINEKIKSKKYTAIKLSHYGVDKSDLKYGDLTVAVDDKEGIAQRYWFRGSWCDAVTTFWHELNLGEFCNRDYEERQPGDHCVIGAKKVINKNESKKTKFVLAWNIPNCNNYWYRDFCTYIKEGKSCEEIDEYVKNARWKNYYATVFEDSTKSCFYSLDNFSSLYKKTNDFCSAMKNSTLDKSVIDAITSTLTVLKSPTVIRLEDGTLYGWEGLKSNAGSCEGTCTHVWAYQYALCFLFPELERSLRDTEFKYDTDQDGRMYFRTALPLGVGYAVQAPCVDGQMSTIIKIYRDWKLTGNTKWLKENWDNLVKTLEYAWSDKNFHEWDRNHDGVLEGRQHHTLDVELFGPSSWLEGMYLAALKAASEMAEFLGHTEKSKEYLKLFEKGYKWTKENLFNGKYFYQKVNLEDKKLVEHFDAMYYWNYEQNQIKYQIGEGSALDQLLGQWHANICGIGDIFDKNDRKTALKHMFKNNVKSSLREYPNAWRVFAVNDEGGSIICTYPDGVQRPVIPIPYCDECMTGFEYAFAGLLISEGFIEEGLTVVKYIRNRYDGEKRNPFNEIECGANYARAMASFSLLPIFSGYTFDLPNNYIGFAPVVEGDFNCFYSTGTGWGSFIKTNNEQKITISSGYLTLESVGIDVANKVKKVFADGEKISFTVKNNRIHFNKITIQKEIRFEVWF